MDQWNVSPPPLYLWSHPDWTQRHRRIAEEHGHSTLKVVSTPMEWIVFMMIFLHIITVNFL
jgi:hypothetical protein